MDLLSPVILNVFSKSKNRKKNKKYTGRFYKQFYFLLDVFFSKSKS
jgi:hypothetical protein